MIIVCDLYHHTLTITKFWDQQRPCVLTAHIASKNTWGCIEKAGIHQAEEASLLPLSCQSHRYSLRLGTASRHTSKSPRCTHLYRESWWKSEWTSKRVTWWVNETEWVNKWVSVWICNWIFPIKIGGCFGVNQDM